MIERLQTLKSTGVALGSLGSQRPLTSGLEFQPKRFTSGMFFWGSCEQTDLLIVINQKRDTRRVQALSQWFGCSSSGVRQRLQRTQLSVLMGSGPEVPNFPQLQAFIRRGSGWTHRKSWSLGSQARGCPIPELWASG